MILGKACSYQVNTIQYLLMFKITILYFNKLLSLFHKFKLHIVHYFMMLKGYKTNGIFCLLSSEHPLSCNQIYYSMESMVLYSPD